MALADFSTPYYRTVRQAGMQRDAQLAQNAYSRFLSADRGTRALDDLNRGMTRGLEGLGSNYARRGLRTSGIFNQAQSDYAQQWLRQQQAVQDEMQQAFRQADLNDASAWADYFGADADANEAKWNEILATASQLRTVTGG